VLQHHKNASRDGVFIEPSLTKAAVSAKLRLDPAFNATVAGAVFAQPLYFTAGPLGRDVVIVATASNEVSALDAATGRAIWRRTLGPPVARANLPCGDVDPVGITGTPVIDRASRTIFLDTMTTPDAGVTKRHLVFALSVDDGSTRAGWPFDVTGIASGGVGFEAAHQNQRAGLALLDGVVYVPYGGHSGDCMPYYGWVVGVPLDRSRPAAGWRTRALGGGVWGVGGIASDGRDLFVTTGNTLTNQGWQDGEAVIRLGPGPTYSGAAADYYAPSNWAQLDQLDLDLGGTGPVLFDLPGFTPSSLIVALGKDGKAYFVDRARLGGIGGEVVVRAVSHKIRSAPAVYRTRAGLRIAFFGLGNLGPAGNGCPLTGGPYDLTVITLTPGATGNPVGWAWCAAVGGQGGAPIVTIADGVGSEAIVWIVSAEGANALHAFDGDTGAPLLLAPIPLGPTRHFLAPIAAKGRIYSAADGRVFALTAE
jgi:outer membrane protein assembly factor BamB